MPRISPRHVVIIAFAALALTTTLGAAKIKVKVDYDKAFDFKPLRTYAWHPKGAGDVKILQNSGDNPEEIKARIDPVIRGVVEQALASRGLTKAASNPDAFIYYYALIGPNIASQTMGQFLRPVPEWGLPPFAPATQSLEIYEQGTLILDIDAASADKMVWRGSASAEIDRQNSETTRNNRIRDGVQEMLKKFPPKK